ncbi:MAG TPA: hydrogenase nickel incorporation protein HypB [Spirochaetota bacterium]|nr:hydrogenase nickel incorporation protein HypB [Spirochaetota bacterium]
MEIKVMKNILNANQNKADEIKQHLKEKKVLMVNIIGSPGAGKTTLLEKTIESLKETYSIAVIEGDVATDRDARRLQKYDIPIVLINTDGACHLESISIQNALAEFDLDKTDIVFVENVGNLVCPAEFDIGEFAKIAVISVTEGDDKPEKYPLLFREAKAMILNKVDLIEYTDFNKTEFDESLRILNGGLSKFEMSCRKNEGLEGWLDWLKNTHAETAK